MTDASAPELRLQSSGDETRRVLGTAGMVDHFLLTKPLELERGSVLSPFGYMQLIWGVLFGYLIFGQRPDSHAFIGMAVIVGSGLYVARGPRARRNEEPDSAIESFSKSVKEVKEVKKGEPDGRGLSRIHFLHAFTSFTPFGYCTVNFNSFNT